MGDDLVKRLLANDLEECDEAADRIEELEAKLVKVTSERDQAVQGDFPLDDKGVTWHELCERWKGCCVDAAAHIEELEAKLENLTIAIGMGWDLDGVVCEARAALANIKDKNDDYSI